MNEEELKRMTDRPFTEKQFTALCFIRENYPGICCDADVALIWQIGGQNLVDDMMRRAVKCKKAEATLAEIESLQGKLDLLHDDMVDKYIALTGSPYLRDFFPDDREELWNAAKDYATAFEKDKSDDDGAADTEKPLTRQDIYEQTKKIAAAFAGDHTEQEV